MNRRNSLRRMGRSLFQVLVAVFILAALPAAAARIAGQEGTTAAAPPPPASQTPDRPAEKARPKPLPQAELLRKTSAPAAAKPAKPEVPPVPAAESDDRSVTIDFDNVDIALFIKFISELTGKNFVVDRTVKGTVTVISPTKITVEEAYKVFESVLEVNGYTTVPSGTITKVVPSVKARAQGIETRLRPGEGEPDDKMVTQIIPLTYASPDDLQKLFTPLISKNSVIVSYPPTRTLIITDMLSNVNRLLRIIREVDLQGIGEEISVIPLRHATAEDMAKSLNSVFHGRTATGKAGLSKKTVTKIVPDERTNSLVVFTTEHDAGRIRELIALLDREIPRGVGKIHVYYLQHANAEDLAAVLMALTLKDKKQGKPGKAAAVAEDVQIVADKATNALVITAEMDDYRVLEEVIRKLDISRQMVYIEALIMEVSVNKQFDLGVEWQLADDTSYRGGSAATYGAFTSGQGNSPSVDPATGAVSLPVGMVLGILGESISVGGITFPNISALVRAYKKDSDIYIRSTPQLLTTDNEEAEIRVGRNIPYLTRQETTTAQIDYSSYEFRDVGVILTITPQINQERFVVLKIDQELTQVIEEESSEGLPVTLKRAARTTVIVQDGNTVVIGGLIDQTMDQGEVKVPFLGDIPILGWLFRSKSSKKGRTNLFIFLTPHIVDNPAQAADVSREKQEHMDEAEVGVIKMYGDRKEKGKENIE